MEEKQVRLVFYSDVEKRLNCWSWNSRQFKKHVSNCVPLPTPTLWGTTPETFYFFSPSEPWHSLWRKPLHISVLFEETNTMQQQIEEGDDIYYIFSLPFLAFTVKGKVGLTCWMRWPLAITQDACVSDEAIWELGLPAALSPSCYMSSNDMNVPSRH